MTDTPTRRVSARTWIGLVIAALAVVFIVQNRGTVTVQLFMIRLESPQWVTLSIVFLLGALAAWLMTRRRQR